MKIARHLHLMGVTGAIRTTSFHGREHIAVPVVALVEGVIFPVNADTPELVLASEFTVAPQGWNGRPVMAGHPVENGTQVSANSPHVLEGRSFGTIFNTKCDGKRLLMEAWLDPVKAKAVGRDAERVIERVQAGESVEVSVGVFVVAEDRHGTFNDKDYKAVWHEITPDHLAMLPEGVLGACSNTMGCGVRTAQVHCVSDQGIEVMGLRERYEAEHPKEPLLKLRPKSAEGHAMTDEELRDAAGKRNSASDQEIIQMMHDKSVDLGASCGAEEPQELKFADRFVRTMEAADGYRAAVANLDPKILEGDKAEHPFSYCMETVIPAMDKAPDDPEAFCGWWKAERNASNRAATLKAAEHNCSCGGQRAAEGDRIMAENPFAKKPKDEKVKELIDDDETPFTKDDEEWLAKVEDEKLVGIKKNAEAKAAARADAAAKAEAEAAKGTADAVARALAEAKPKSEAEWLSAAPEGLRRMYNRAAQAEATEKANLIASLKTAQSEFPEEELTAMSVEQLQRLSRVAKVAETPTVVDFGVRVPRVAAASSDVIPPPPDMNERIRAARAK